jgi:hypothetical protein
MKGVFPGHAYGILDVHDVKDKHGEAIRLVKVRNPWG